MSIDYYNDMVVIEDFFIPLKTDLEKKKILWAVFEIEQERRLAKENKND